MARELKLSIGQHSDQGRKESNQDFHGAMMPAAAGARPEGRRGGAGRRDQQQQRQPGRQRIGGQRLPDRLLLHVRCLVGEDLGAARHRRHQFLAARADAAQRVTYEQTRDRGYVCTLSVVVLKARTAHIFHVGDSRVYRVAGSRWSSSPTTIAWCFRREQIYLGRALGIKPAGRDRLPAVPARGRRRLPAGDRRRLRACRRRRASPTPSPPTRTISTGPRKAIVAEAFEARQPRQPHGPDRAGRCPAGRRCGREPGDRGRPAAAAAARAAPGFDGYRIVRSSTAAAAATSISRSTARARGAGGPQDPVDRPARPTRPT